MDMISSWFRFSTNYVEEEQNSWHTWQLKQPEEHYKTSSIYSYYKSQRTHFSTNKTFFKEPVYRYCFGDFCYLIVNPKDNEWHIMIYLQSILDVYDVCKGITRRITGDPNYITMLRDVIKHNNYHILRKHNFMPYIYDYESIHAHTVAQYSLSTLLMFILSHYLSQHDAFIGINYPSIQFKTCQKAYLESNFGTTVKPTLPLDIGTPKQKQKDIKWFSWPEDKSSCIKCKCCGRVTEREWGDFSSCLDCHIHKVCHICGDKSVAIICNDQQLPKCLFH